MQILHSVMNSACPWQLEVRGREREEKCEIEGEGLICKVYKIVAAFTIIVF